MKLNENERFYYFMLELLNKQILFMSYRWDIFWHCSRVGSVEKCRCLILNVVHFDQDVGSCAKGRGRVSWVVSCPDHHVVRRSKNQTFLLRSLSC